MLRFTVRRAAILILVLGIPIFAYMPRRVVTPSGLAFQKWADASLPIVWRLSSSAPGSNINGGRSVADVMRASFQAWSGVSTAKMSFSEGATTSVRDAALDGINLISVAPLSSIAGNAAAVTTIYTYDTIGTDPLSRPILFPGQILEADIVFNPAVAFSTDLTATADRMDLQTRAIHEIGHLLGLDHSGLVSSVMYPVLQPGAVRPISLDDEIGLSILYPASSFWTSRGTIHGSVRLPPGVAVYGAHVVVQDAQGKAIASSISGLDGVYQVSGLPAGSYQAYAEPLDGPLTPSSLETLTQSTPGQTPNSNITTRFAGLTGTTTPNITLSKTGGDNQTAAAGQVLPAQLEVEARSANGAVQPGIVVTFRAASGGGTVVPIEATTDAQGKARAKAFLGLGSSQLFTATAFSSVATFSAATQPAAITSVTFLDSFSDAATSEIVVNEGSSSRVRLRVRDVNGLERPDAAPNYNVQNTDIATIDSTGTIQGKRAGFSTFTASAGGVTATATVSVVQVIPRLGAFDTTGIVQDTADGMYAAATADHTIRFSGSPQQAPQVYAGVSGAPGFQNGARLESSFRNPAFLALDKSDGSLYVSDSLNHAIRKVTPGSNGKVETLAGTGQRGSQDGAAATASFNNPQGIALDNQGSLWVADSDNHTIRRINLLTQTVTTIAGLAGTPGSNNGIGGAARFRLPVGIAVDAGVGPDGVSLSPKLIVADTGNGLLRRVSFNGSVETIQGTDSSAASVFQIQTDGKAFALDGPSPGASGVTVDAVGNIYFTDPSTGAVRILLRNGQLVSAAQANTFRSPKGLIARGGRVTVAEPGGAQVIRFGEPQITNAPVSIRSTGGEHVTIQGNNFAPDTIFAIGGQFVLSPRIDNTQQATFTTPVAPSGVTTLTVQNRGGIAQRAIFVDGIPLSSLTPGQITTVAGGSTYGGDGGPASSATFQSTSGAKMDSEGNLYVVEQIAHRIRKIEASTGRIFTVAGTGQQGFSGDAGPAIGADLQSPGGIAVDKAGNLFIADSFNYRVRRVDALSGLITTIVGGGSQSPVTDTPGTSVKIGRVFGVTTDAAGNVFMADVDAHRILLWNASTGTVRYVAGNGAAGFSGDGGAATAAALDFFGASLAIDRFGNLFIEDTNNTRIRKIAAGTGIITTIAGPNDIVPYAGGLNGGSITPGGPLAIGPDGFLYFSDFGRLCRINLETGQIERVDGFYPGSVIDATGTLFHAFDRQVLRRSIGSPWTVISGQTLSQPPSGPAIAANLNHPAGIAIDGAGNAYVADTYNFRILKISKQSGEVSLVAGTGEQGFSGDGQAAVAARLDFVFAIAIDRDGNLLISSNNRIRKVTFATGIITTVAGTGFVGTLGDGGPALQATFYEPRGFTVDRTTGDILIADEFNHRIRRIAANTGIVTTIAGNGAASSSGDGGLAVSAGVNLPISVAVDNDGTIFIAEVFNGIRKIVPATGVITKVADLGSVSGIAVDPSGNLYAAGSTQVFKLAPPAYSPVPVAGTGLLGYSGDGGPAQNARLGNPWGITFDPSGNLWIADYYNSRIRVVRGPIP